MLQPMMPAARRKHTIPKPRLEVWLTVLDEPSMVFLRMLGWLQHSMRMAVKVFQRKEFPRISGLDPYEAIIPTSHFSNLWINPHY